MERERENDTHKIYISRILAYETVAKEWANTQIITKSCATENCTWSFLAPTHNLYNSQITKHTHTQLERQRLNFGKGKTIFSKDLFRATFKHCTMCVWERERKFIEKPSPRQRYAKLKTINRLDMRWRQRHRQCPYTQNTNRRERAQSDRNRKDTG